MNLVSQADQDPRTRVEVRERPAAYLSRAHLPKIECPLALEQYPASITPKFPLSSATPHAKCVTVSSGA